MMFYCRQMEYKHRHLTVLLQNENGPCPLLAVANALALKGAIVIPAPSSSQPLIPVVTVEDLIKEYFSHQRALRPDDENAQYVIDSAVRQLPELAKGLVVNPKFDRIDHFEPTEELSTFDASRIRLVHGLTLDPQESELRDEIGQNSYNVMLVKTTDPSSVPKFFEWMEQFPTQLSYHGLIDLTHHVREDEIAVLFRNNHFAVVTKVHGVLYTLVTDVGVVQAKPSAPWESLVDLTGESSVFRDSHFAQAPPSPAAIAAAANSRPPPLRPIVDGIPVSECAEAAASGGECAAPHSHHDDDEDMPTPPRRNSQLVRRDNGDREVVQLNREDEGINSSNRNARRKSQAQEGDGIAREYSAADGNFSNGTSNNNTQPAPQAAASSSGGQKASDDRCCSVM
ncbi:Hypothetical protein, putative [Bodo saltans]|uniref:MINDY deubiquitinase domain-containing protein n=1 Tax=Bodo saltans TaxID=75058 RepID=A0A0S4JD03_BODSA|nr:Hypothetical protein, putative [Bodo saltans]|eukprot:CUG88029.1 Hypothetical protein, putative [Bodo saltans]